MQSFKEYILSEIAGKEKINGWLGPNGKLYTCNSPFCHANLVLKTPELKKHVTEENIKLSFDTGGVEHIYFDMWKAGFLRISSSSSWSNGIIDPEMYFEGTVESFKNLYQKAKDVAETYGRKEVFVKANI